MCDINHINIINHLKINIPKELKMRIISGKYKGKNLKGDNINGTRPTMDRIKESLFGSIQNNIKESICLDLFAGSGSLGLEAISNGATSCYLVDKNKEVIKILQENIKGFEEEISIINDDYQNALNNFKNNKIKFDIIFLDPPYNLNLIGPAIKKIEEYNLLNENGLLVCEYETELFNSNYKIIKEKEYGNKKIIIYKNINKFVETIY